MLHQFTEPPNQSGEGCGVGLMAKFEDFGKNGESEIHPIQMGERINEDSESVKVGWNSKRIHLVRKRKDSGVVFHFSRG